MELQLETRKCSNKRCTRSFRVLHDSKQEYCSSACATGIFGVQPTRAKGKGEDEKASPDEVDAVEATDPNEGSASEADSLM